MCIYTYFIYTHICDVYTFIHTLTLLYTLKRYGCIYITQCVPLGIGLSRVKL